MILRQCLEGEEEVVVDKEKKSGTHMSITCIRVSPDERYLAYVVRSKKQAFLAGPRETVYIRNLITNREAEIATYGYVGNLMWSPAGERLYFAGGGYSSDSAIRVVDVKAPNSL